MSEGEVSVPEALERIGSSSLTERNKGLTELSLIFKHNANSTRLEVVTDKGYHLIFEALFRCATTEKSLYVNASKKTTKTSAAARLSQCAGVLRSVVEAGVRDVKMKTAFALLDHITQTLPMSDGGLCEPLTLSYTKALRLLLEFQPHVEHLPRKKRWEETIDFCVDTIQVFGMDTDKTQTTRTSSYGSLRSPDGSVEGALRSSVRDSGSRTVRTGSASEATELVACLRLLTHASNVPLLEKAQPILSTLTAFLQDTRSTNSAYQDAFTTINNVLMRTALDAVTMAQGAVRELIPVIKEAWSTKQTSLRDEMVRTLILSRPHIAAMFMNPAAHSIREDMESLLETLRLDYSRRPEREQLQVDDLVLRPIAAIDRKLFPMSSANLALRTGNNRSESQWSIVSLLAYFSVKLDSSSISDEAQVQNRDFDGPRKRTRIAKNLDEHLSQLSHPSAAVRLCALQTLALCDQANCLVDADLQKILDHLTSMLSDSLAALSSWAMVALSTYCSQQKATAPRFQTAWVKIFQIASRSLTSTATSRSACHLMSAILDARLVQYISVADTIEGIVSSIELTGPATLCDSTISFWTCVLHTIAAENPSAATMSTERILHWLCNRWTPSEYLVRNPYAAIDSVQASLKTGAIFYSTVNT